MATFKDFEGKPLGILCLDSLVITGVADSLDLEAGTITLRQATTFFNGSVIKKPNVVIDRDSVVDACVLPSLESLSSLPDLRHFPSFRTQQTNPQLEVNSYPPERAEVDNLSPKHSANFTGVSTIEGLEDEFERLSLRNDGYGSGLTYRETHIARGKKYQHPQPLFEELEAPAPPPSNRSRTTTRRAQESALVTPKRQPASSSHRAPVIRGGSPSDYPESKSAHPRKNKVRNRYQAPDDSDVNDSDYPLSSSADRTRALGLEPRTFVPTRHRLKKEPVDWCLDNVIGPEKVQFDFQGNLNLFNKAEEFAKIREQDTVPYEDRLVGHNRRPSRFDFGRQSPFPPPPRNLKNTENVLGVSPENAAASPQLTPGTFKRVSLSAGKHLMRTTEGLFCPIVDRDVLLQVERLAISETGPNLDQLIENAGRSIALMALKALGGGRRMRHDNHGPPPVVVILSGNNQTGAYGASAARHLANRGCQVKLLVAGNPRTLLKMVYEQQRHATCSDVELVSGMRDLPDAIACPVDLIIDALLGYEFTLAAVPDSGDRISTADLIDWANANDAPVISVGAPSGLMGDSAHSGFSPTSDYVHPKWTLALGAPTTALCDRSAVGEVYLGDLGIPTPVWRRVGVQWRCPFGADFLVRLDYF